MKEFFKMVLAVIVGSFLLYVIGFFIIMGIGASFGSSDKAKVKANSILKLDFKQYIPDMTDNAEQEGFSLDENAKQLGLRDYLAALDRATSDDKIKGVFLEFDGVAMSMANAGEIRQALAKFKEKGKFVTYYGTNVSQKAYYIGSVADKVYLHPMGSVDMRGLSVEITFLKNLFDKWGLKPQIFYCGKFKSATEPLRRTDMSPENKQQLREILSDNYAAILTEIGASRGLSYQQLEAIINSYEGRDAQRSLAAKLVDGLKYKDEIIDEMKGKLGVGKDKDIEAIGIADYAQATMPKIKSSIKNKVAVVYCEGEIGDDSEEPGTIGGDQYAKMLRNIRKDDNIKAVVLRINSPGGSALASENIWREVERLKQEGKVVIASMGSVAASGGYYIASNSSMILAQPNTITGSIGVFGIIPNVRQFTNQTLGVTVDTVRIGKYAAMNPLYYDMTAEEAGFVQQSVDSIYLTFKSRVANGRKLTLAQVEEVAQGRVWTGKKAKQFGLVDSLGTLQDAINIAASQAGLKDQYRVVEYPEMEDKFTRLLKQFGFKKAMMQAMREESPEMANLYEVIKFARTRQGIMMRLPFDVQVN